MTSREKIEQSLKYLGKDHFYTEYDYDLQCRLDFRSLPKQLKKDRADISFYLGEKLLYHGRRIFSEEEIWIIIEDENIEESILKNLLPVFADRCLYKAKKEAHKKLMIEKIQKELIDNNIGFYIENTKWDKLIESK